MNPDLLEQLLNENESAYLDFKRKQYPFAGADDKAKSELLKDILAFTNAWRRTDAFVLIGVEEVRGGRSNVVGVSTHLDDHSLQQFVNSKTQRPITFSYIPFACEGKEIGIIQIPVQARPVYLKNSYGKLGENMVYIRRGSSTDQASPDEIAKMGMASATGLNELSLDLQFSNIETRALLGDPIELSSTLLSLPDSANIPDFDPVSRSSNMIGRLGQANRNYYRQLVKYYMYQYMTKPIGFAVKNQSQVTAYNVRMLITAEQQPNLTVLLESGFPARPRQYHHFLDIASDIAPTPSLIGPGNQKSNFGFPRQSMDPQCWVWRHPTESASLVR